MENQTYYITFKEISGEIASRYASELRNALLDAVPDIEVGQKRGDARTLDFGNTLVVVLGTQSVLAVANVMIEWLKMRHKVTIDIQKGKNLHVENVTSKDALKLQEFFIKNK